MWCISMQKWKGTYKYIDTMICCSEFMKSKMDSNPLFATKTVAMHNFIDKVEWKETEKKDYVLYFGRFSEEKGIGTLIKVCKELPDVQFIFAGTGPLEETVRAARLSMRFFRGRMSATVSMNCSGRASMRRRRFWMLHDRTPYRNTRRRWLIWNVIWPMALPKQCFRIQKSSGAVSRN